MLQELHAKLASLNNKEKKFNSLLQTTEKKFLLPTFNKLTGKMSIDILLQAEKHLLTRMWFSNGLHKEKSIDFDPASKSSIGETEMEAIAYSTGWVFKKVYEKVNSAQTLSFKSEDENIAVDKNKVMLILDHLCQSKKQSDGKFQYVPSELSANFIVSLHWYEDRSFLNTKGDALRSADSELV